MKKLDEIRNSNFEIRNIYSNYWLAFKIAVKLPFKVAVVGLLTNNKEYVRDVGENTNIVGS